MSNVITIAGHKPSDRQIEDMAKRTAKKLASEDLTITSDTLAFLNAMDECSIVLEQISKMATRLDDCRDSRLEKIKALACSQIERNRLILAGGMLRDAKSRRIQNLEKLIDSAVYQMAFILRGCIDHDIDVPAGFDAVHRMLQSELPENK